MVSKDSIFSIRKIIDIYLHIIPQTVFLFKFFLLKFHFITEFTQILRIVELINKTQFVIALWFKNSSHFDDCWSSFDWMAEKSIRVRFPLNGISYYCYRIVSLRIFLLPNLHTREEEACNVKWKGNFVFFLYVYGKYCIARVFCLMDHIFLSQSKLLWIFVWL